MFSKCSEFLKKMPMLQWFNNIYNSVVGSQITIYFILFCAYFHNILRISQGSDITLFRVLIPLSLCIIFKHSRKVFLVLCICSGAFVVLSVIQYILSRNVFFPEIDFDFVNMIKFWIHLLSIFMFTGLIVVLKKIEGGHFLKKYTTFNTIIIKCAIICDILFLLSGQEYKKFSLFGNINDFGCAMVAGMAIILCGNTPWLSKGIWCGCIFVLLYKDDSKLALIGAVMMVIIFGIIEIDKYYYKKSKLEDICADKNHEKIKNGICVKTIIFRYWRLLSVLIFLILCLCLLFIPIKINGYNVGTMIKNAFSQLFSGEYYDNSESSLLFRVNAVIGIGTVLKKTLWFGVGVGNTGVILRVILPSMDTMFENHIYVAPHIWWLELFADIGIVVIIPAVVLFGCHIKRFLTKHYIDTYDILQSITLLSFPVWCMSSSGLYTEYYTLSLIIVAIIGFAPHLSRWLPKIRNGIFCVIGKNR